LIKLTYQRHSFLKDSDLSVFKLINNIAARLCVNEALAFHKLKEAANSILLFDPVEPYHCILPLLIKNFIFFSFFFHAIFIKLIVLEMFLSITFIFMIYPFFNEFINFWCEEESNIDQILSHRL